MNDFMNYKNIHLLYKAVRLLYEITKLRISAHPLEIKTGRHSKPRIPKTFYCLSKSIVEDESCFLYECFI